MPVLARVLAILFGVLAGLTAGVETGALAAPSEPTAAVQAPSLPLTAVIDARFGIHPDMTRFVLELTALVAYRVSTDSNPDRVVIDVADLAWPGGSGPTPGKGMVKAYRVAAPKPGLMRLTLETSGPAALRNVELIPAREGYQPRLVIDLRPAVQGEVARQTVRGGPRSAVLDGEAPPQPRPLTPPSAGKPAARPANLPAAPAPPPPPAKPLIAIDAGHGGPDPGAISASGVQEKTLTLAAAREMRRQLEASGRYRVMLTRDRDDFLPLRERVAVARDAGADLFVSLHADIIDNPAIGGLSIYTLSDTASDHEAETLAAKENRADAITGMNLATENKEVASILISLAQRDTMNQSNRLAGIVLRDVAREVELLPIKPHRQAGFAVLTAPDVPSVLIELGYLSNRRDHDHLTSAAFRERFARGMVRSLDGYFKWLVEARKS
jgi:N-acetylmuramoyl-L-alanine amidase